MASDYPGGLDDFTTIAADDKTSDTVGGRTHRDMHNDLGDAVESIEAELGTDPSGTYDTVKARIAAIEAGTLPPIDAKGDIIAGTADNTYDNVAVGANNTLLVADSAQTAGVKWANVTSAMITDGTIVSGDVAAGTFAAFSTVGNLLTPNQASGTDTLGDTTGFAAAGATLASSTAQAWQGSRSLAMTATSAGDASANTGLMSVTVNAATPFTALIVMRTDQASGEVGQLNLRFFDSSDNQLVSVVSATAVLSNAAWTAFQVTGTAPANTAKAMIIAYRAASGASGAVTYLDGLSLHRGVGGTFSMPGVPVVGQSPVLVSPDGTQYVLTVANGGAVTASALS